MNDTSRPVDTVNTTQLFNFEPRASLFEWSDVKRHAQDRRDSDDEKNERSNQRQRHRKDALAMDEPFRPHRLPQVAQSQHELHVIDDAQDKHHDAEPNQSEAEITRRSGLGDDIL